MSSAVPPSIVVPEALTGSAHAPDLDASVALLIHDAHGGVQIGSAVLVGIGHRFLVATAAHNLEGVASSRWVRVLPRGRYHGDPIRFAARSRGRWEDLDVGWIELEAAVVERRALRFLHLEQLGPRGTSRQLTGAIGVDRLWVHGYGAHGVDAQLIAGTRFTLEATTVRSLRIRPGEPVLGYRKRTDLAVAWPPPDRAVHAPAGLSGGAIWSDPGREQVGLLGLTRSWNRQRGLLLGTRIEHWLRRVHAELPDLRPAVESVLDRR